MNMCLEKLHDAGVRAVSVTADGTSCNQQMAAQLGISLDPNNMETTFPHPSDPTVRIAFFFDPCHMIKLVRNMMSVYRCFKLPGVGIVDWAYIERLMEMQKVEKLSAGNKGGGRHINYQNEKMKVSLAVQVLSSSVADALEFARQLGKLEFQGCEATVQFIRTIDRVFDILNSRNCRGKGYKAPISKRNVWQTLGFLEKARVELKSLEDTLSIPLYKSRRKMGIVGLLINIESIKWLSHTLLLQDEIPCSFLLTYKFSQDHLELYFGAIRAAGGHNNNPTCRQFGATYRKLLARCDVAIGSNTVGNVSSIDTTCLLDVNQSERTLDEAPEESNYVIGTTWHLEDHPYAIDGGNLTLFVENVVTYISGFVARKLIKVLVCDKCKYALVNHGQEDTLYTTLLNIKSRGGLICPSESLRNVVSVCERMLRVSVDLSNLKTHKGNWGLKLETAIMERFVCRQDVFPDLFDHMFDTEDTENHWLSLLRNVVKEYLKIRRFFATKKYNEHLKGDRIRHKLTKSILFQNQ